ncbi:MAG TPA: serine/threonine-protein kinase [Kofleriaceae bacterium]|nr:serine/threonine-protein kinase [Kofleriaceae bacterium]
MTVLDGHVIEELLGRGTSGAVYRARDPAGRAVAIKVLHPELLPSPQHVHRFVREARALSLLRHPHVIAVERVGRLEGGQPYLVMELLAGRSLEAVLAERGRFAVEDVDRIMRPLCDALGAAHALGIVHRDLKPSNIFMASAPDGGERVVLLDFGIAKLLDEEGITSAREVVGTPSSIAPEQILGRRVDARTDVYGLGALCYQLLTGRPPFSGSMLLTLQHHLQGVPRRASTYAVIPAELDRVLQRALAKAPERRFADARGFLAALRAAMLAPLARVGDPGQKTLAMHVEVQAPLAGGDEAVRADVESILALVTRATSTAGWVVLMETGESMLAAVACPDRPARRAAVDAVLAMATAIRARPRAQPPVTARIRLRLDRADRIEDWLPPAGGTGVLATPAVVDQLDLEVEPAGDEIRIAAPAARLDPGLGRA